MLFGKISCVNQTFNNNCIKIFLLLHYLHISIHNLVKLLDAFLSPNNKPECFASRLCQRKLRYRKNIFKINCVLRYNFRCVCMYGYPYVTTAKNSWTKIV